MSKPTSPTYKTTNWAAYNAALKRRGSLTIWFDPEMKWDAEPSGKRGRSRTFSDAAIQTCLTMKVLFGMALRQKTGFVESLLRLTGLDWVVPDFSTICRRQRTLAVNIPYRGAKGPLHLLIDSTGIKVEGEGEWNARKHGGRKRRVWRKVHIRYRRGLWRNERYHREVRQGNRPLHLCSARQAPRWAGGAVALVRGQFRRQRGLSRLSCPLVAEPL